MSVALAQVDTGWSIPNTTFWCLKILPGKVWSISRSSFPCKGLQSETNYYPGLQDGSSPLERDVGKHSTSTKFQRKSHLVLTFGWDQIWKGFPSHLVPERPREQSVVVSFHDNEEQGHVSSFPCPIPVQVHPQTHLVAVLCSVES